MKALLFPGQGSQIVGMGVEFYNNFKKVKNLFQEADESLKFKISKIILDGPESELKLTKNTQPAILTVSFSIYNILKDEFGMNSNDFKFFAGHSLGEYSALVCSKSLKFNDALFLLHERGKAMQEAVPEGKGAMIAVLGSEIEIINQCILEIKKNKKEVCEIANDNAPGQIIVSGEIELINNLNIALKNKKIKSIILPVSAPFHCSLMLSAAEKMSDKIKKTNFLKPSIEILSNVTALPENEPEKIKKLLIEQIYSKVRWRESIIYMNDKNISQFIEIGPGKILTGMVKRIAKNSKSSSINSLEDAKNIFK
jgi:[acyl-carrier-protein] S-malonyltransferase